MYNRYTLNRDGTYRCQQIRSRQQQPASIPEEPAPCPEPPEPPKAQEVLNRAARSDSDHSLDLGDLLVLAILLLLLLDETEDSLPILLAGAAFFLF